MTSLSFSQAGAEESYRENSAFSARSSAPIPPAPSFSSFRFHTIGQVPELLKRISAPAPDIHYQDDHRSPSPSFQLQYPSKTPEPSLSSSSFLQALSNSSNHVDATTTDTAEDMIIDGSLGSEQQNSHSPTGLMRPAHSETSHQSQVNSSTNQQAGRNFHSSICSSNDTPLPQHLRAHSTQSDPKSPSEEILEASNGNVVNRLPATLHTTGASSPTASSIHLPHTSHATAADTGACASDSQYTVLHMLHFRLMSSLSNLNIPDTNNALLLAQAANSHASNALSSAHRSHTLAQQALTSAHEAVSAAQECLNAAEQAKVHASEAVAAVEEVGVAKPDGFGSEWEWKTIISSLQDDLCALGEWVRERQGEEAMKRSEAEKFDKASQDKELIENTMRMDHGLTPEVVQSMAAEVARRTAEDVVRSSLGPVREHPGHRSPINRGQDLQRTAEIEADAARRAWSVEHESLPEADLNRAAEEAREQLERHADSQATLLAQREQLEGELKRQEEAEARARREQREAEVKAQRLAELKAQKLEVAKFQMEEREKLERLQKEEVDRRVAEDQWRRQAIEKRKADATRRLAQEQARRAAAVEKEKIEREGAGEQTISPEERRRILEERKRQELEDFKKKQGAQARAAAEAEAMAIEAKAQEEQAAEAKAKEQEAAREAELLEAQDRKRQEVMAQKHRAHAETAARINADRARGQAHTEKVTPSTQSSRSPVILHQSLPSPVFHTLPLVPTQINTRPVKLAKPQEVSPEATGLQAETLSGGVRLGTTDELGGNVPAASPPLLQPPVTGTQIVGAKKAIPLPLPKPRPSKGAKERSASSTSVPSLRTSNIERTSPLSTAPAPVSHQAPSQLEYMSVHRDGQDPGNILIIPQSQLSPTSFEAQGVNLRFVRDTWSARPSSTFPTKSEKADNEGPSPSPNERKRKLKVNCSPAASKRSKTSQELGPSKLDKSETPPDSLLLRVDPLDVLLQDDIPLFSNPNDGHISTPIVSAMQPASARLPATAAENIAVDRSRRFPDNMTQRDQIGESSATMPSTLGLSGKTRSLQALPRVPQVREPQTEAIPILPDAASNAQRPYPNINVHQAASPTAPASSLELTTVTLTRGEPGTNLFRTRTPDPFDDGSQIAPVIHGHGGWDTSTPLEEDTLGHSARPRELSQGRVSKGGSQHATELLSPQHTALYSLDNPSTTKSPPVARTQFSSPTYSPPSRGRQRRGDFRSAGPSGPNRYQGVEHDSGDRYRPHVPRSPIRPQKHRPVSPERFGGLQSRIGGRDTEAYRGDSYRPRHVSDSYIPDSPYYTPYEDSGRQHNPMLEQDQYMPYGRHQSAERPDLLDRMSLGASYRGRGTGAPRGSIRSRGVRGRSRPLEQRISSNDNSQSSMGLMNRLESPPRS